MTSPTRYSAITICFLALLYSSWATAEHPISPQDKLLSNYDYPYPVNNFPLELQGYSLTMAFMDIPPAKGNKPKGTVLLLHGKNFSSAYWKDTIASLSQLGYRVIAPDQIGFGKSSKPLMQYNLHSLSNNTKRLLDALKVKKVSVVGHSMGGMLATRFTLMYPASVEKLALVNPIGLEDWKRWVPYEPLPEAIARESRQTPKSIKRYMSNAYFSGQWRKPYDPLLDIQAGWTLGPDAKHMATVDALTSEMVFTQPVLYEFADLKVPTLLIIGTRDRTAVGRARATPTTQDKLGRYDQLGKKTASSIPNAELVEMNGVGHLPQFEAFPSYFGALSQFLKAPTPKTAPQ
ncbi:alpha/beta hydrolase [Microbulbifer sp. OS29]|uniref:Alpha/beta hydrolase n=1 Tax=Microbulbifer okhotskensis TaxID=2926617 RepID=A0A9X2EP36_9GAMM|nr:alpha/beta fold hydrolase [Microbulbifer okhotskensis]MCO1332991.1 alpha/beta hydrolase [Microbulbifer okhotskensis]